MSERSQTRSRALTVGDLGLADLPVIAEEPGTLDETETEALTAPETLLDESDEILRDVRHAIQDGFAGVIFVGPPGTGKTWYAGRIALTLVEGDAPRVRFVQFHPSFQYEDFVEGYVPDTAGRFSLTPKHLRIISDQAAAEPDKTHVLVIDEISRCDAARVFGEALTYIEMSKRGMLFRLSSGTEMRIPANLVILATMNPWDRGVDDMDMALERRFCHIPMPPRPEKLRDLLAQGSFSQDAIDSVVRFFEALQRLPNPMCHIGHAYFLQARDEASLNRLWRTQLHYHFERACRLNLSELTKIESMWAQMVETPLRATPPGTTQREESSGPEPQATA